MDIHQLVTFERIVREGSFSQAGRALNITQPTISGRIQALEEEVGGPLFVRGSRRATLTERGASFLPYAQRILSILAEGIEVSQLTQDGKHGRLTMGAISSLASSVLVRTITHFHQLYPDVEIFVRTGHSKQVETLLYDGIVSLGLVVWPFFSSGLKPLLFLREPILFVVPPNHPLAKHPFIRIEDLPGQAMPILGIRWGTTINSILAKIVSHASMSVPLETARPLLLQGIGTAFFTRSLVEEDLLQGRLVEVKIQDLPPLFYETALVHRSKLSATSSNFLHALRQITGIETSEHPW